MIPTRSFLFRAPQPRIFLAARYAKQPDEDVVTPHVERKFAGFLQRILGISSKTSNAIITKHRELLSTEPRDVENTVETLKSLNFKESDILTKPMILYSNALTLENRYRVLEECGFQAISIPTLFKFLTALNREISKLKALELIPKETDVTKKLEQCFADVEVKLKKDFGDNIVLKQLRKEVLEVYLKSKLSMSRSEIDKMWKSYFRVKHKSFKSIEGILNILLNDLGFPRERIINNGYLIHGDPVNVKRILSEVKSIAGEDIREIIYRRPKILMTQCDSMLKTIEHVKSVNIPESSIVKCLDILTLSPDTVLERLEDLKKTEEFNVLLTNPRILRLVHYQNKARIRLEYLNQLRVRCTSLHVLSGASDVFEKFARDGSDKTKGRDSIIFLANTLNKTEVEIRNALSRHPNWCHIPVVSVKICYDNLIGKRFTPDDIYKNIHILLYPPNRINEKLAFLQTQEFYDSFNLDTNVSLISNCKLLTMCLYLIEQEFHFTGDGMWTEQHINPMENFHNILPDFPESSPKVYKFGTKPAKIKNKAGMII